MRVPKLLTMGGCGLRGGNTDIETMQSLSYPDAWLDASGYKDCAASFA